MREGRYQALLVVGVALCLAISLVDPLFPREQFLQHAPTVVALPLLFLSARRRWLSNAAMTCIVAFLLLHVVGARYTYIHVPFGESFSILALGGDGGDRNHYDRLVHLAYGVFAMVPLVEIAQRYGGLPRAWARALALFVVLGMSAVYESFEWVLTLVADPVSADRYNGQQGDAWDAQKDMALAALGALSLLPFVGVSGRGEPAPAP